MAKAIVDSTLPSQFAHAADAIISLINSKPRSPTRDELIAVLEETQPAKRAQIALKLADEIRALRRLAIVEYDTDCPASEARHNYARERIAILEQVVWSKLPTTLDELLTFAEIAYFHQDAAPDHLELLAAFTRGDDPERVELSAAHLIRAVLAFGGRYHVA